MSEELKRQNIAFFDAHTNCEKRIDNLEKTILEMKAVIETLQEKVGNLERCSQCNDASTLKIRLCEQCVSN